MTFRFPPLRHLLPLLASAALVAGCELIAVNPEPGDLRGEWSVNEQEVCQAGKGTPVLVRLRLENTFSRRVRLPHDGIPVLNGQSAGMWRSFEPWPKTLDAGGVWTGMWLLEGELAPGRYEVTLPGMPVIGARSAVVEIGETPSPLPVVTHYQGVIARITGTTAELAEELAKRCASGDALPSTHLTLAELLAADGDREEARAHYETFAEKVYGVDGLPNWLHAKIEQTREP